MVNLTGQTIDRYHILEQIGEGGMAVVYKAYDVRLEREVAIKIIRKEAFPPESLDRIFKRFEREAKALARLAHPNIVKVYDFGEYEGSPYLVMEFQPGGTLKAILGKPLAWTEVSQLIIPIARGIGYAHQKGILHRDVKPSNILITENNEPMLTDFGIAKILDLSDGQTLTGTGLGVGTPEYMAPEQGLGKEVDARADIYSLGVVLYELVTGRKPYTADTPMAVIIKHISDPLPLPSAVFPNLQSVEENLLIKVLAKDPVNRYQSMAELVVAMEKVSDLDGWRNTKENISTAAAGQVKPDKTIDEIKPVIANTPDTRSTEREQTPNQKPDIPPGASYGDKAKPGQRFKWWQIAFGGSILVILFLLFRPVISPTNLIKGTLLPIFAVGEDATTKIPEATPILEIGSTQISPRDGMVMVYVPEGEFIMGAEYGNSDERPVHTVYLDAYWIDQMEVTNTMYHQCVAAGSCTGGDSFGSDFDGDLQPVVGVDWNQAMNYCNWAGRELPTEAQWEKAARGDDGRTYPWGQGVDINRANYIFNIRKTVNVGSYPDGASPYGVLDMAGNVWEWVADWYGENYYGNSPINNPTGPFYGEYRVLRGGSWYNDARVIRSTIRLENLPTNTYYGFGFRCALPLP